MENATLMRRDVAGELSELAGRAEACRACALGHTRTQAVFGTGNPHAEIMFVGEAPGFHEDQQGQPFVGAAGRLLTKLIESKLQLARADVYITNTLMCRPPDNRDPQPAEIDACRPFVDRQLELVDPLVVMTLGNFATKLLLETTTGITRLHGRRFPWRGRVLIPAFHPAAALRGGSAVQGIQQDFEEARRALVEARAERAEIASKEPSPTEQLGLF